MVPQHFKFHESCWLKILAHLDSNPVFAFQDAVEKISAGTGWQLTVVSLYLTRAVELEFLDMDFATGVCTVVGSPSDLVPNWEEKYAPFEEKSRPAFLPSQVLVTGFGGAQ